MLLQRKSAGQAEEVLQVFAKDFRQFWEVVSNKEASVDMVDACLKGAYRLGITQPQYRCWLPLSKVGETMAILKIMHSNLSMDRGDLAQSVHDAQAAVSLTIIPGSSACCPKAMSAMWFAQACRALGRVSVVRGHDLSSRLASPVTAVKRVPVHASVICQSSSSHAPVLPHDEVIANTVPVFWHLNEIGSTGNSVVADAL